MLPLMRARDEENAVAVECSSASLVKGGMVRTHTGTSEFSRIYICAKNVLSCSVKYDNGVCEICNPCWAGTVSKVYSSTQE